jgi:cytosine deaminase
MSWLPDLPADTWLRHARIPAALLGGPAPGPLDFEGLVRCDLRLSSGRIAAIAPVGTAPDGVDLAEGQVWPCFVDGHTHLDKNGMWPRARNVSGDHVGAIEAVRNDRRAHWNEADIAARFDFALRCAHAHGTAAIRTHLDSYGTEAEHGWAVFRRLRDAWAGRIALQAVAICTIQFLDGDEGVALANLVARSGGILGLTSTGVPTDDALRARIDRVFALAEERGLDLDLHLDESSDPSQAALRVVAETALRRGFKRRIQVGHVCALSVQPEAEAAETIRLCAAAGIAVIVLPMCNMYLQGRMPGRTPTWRGITQVHEFAAAGVPVSFASDNCHDPFYCYGDYDMAEVFREAVRICQLDVPFATWPASVSATPAEVCGFTGLGRIAVGASADLVLFRGRSMTELLSRPQSDRVVLRAGRPLRDALPDWRELDAVVGAP